MQAVEEQQSCVRYINNVYLKSIKILLTYDCPHFLRFFSFLC